MNLLNRKMQICMMINIAFLCGCLAKYPPVKDIDNSALLKFGKNNYEFASNSSIQFFSVSNKFECGNSVRAAKYLADLRATVFYLPDTNADEIRVETKDPFRMYVHNSAGSKETGYADCNFIFSFPTEKNKAYKIVPKSSYISRAFYRSGTYTCSVEVSEIADKEGALSPHRKVNLTEYSKCPALY
jgi:hypothetical protein